MTHKIDPAVDGERDNIGSTLQKVGKAKALAYYLPKDAVQDALFSFFSFGSVAFAVTV